MPLLLLTLGGSQRALGSDELFAAVRSNSLEDITNALAKDGVHVDVVNAKGQTPLMHAVLLGNTDAVKHLLDKHGADHTIVSKDHSKPDNDGYLPMHGAAYQVGSPYSGPALPLPAARSRSPPVRRG